MKNIGTRIMMAVTCAVSLIGHATPMAANAQAPEAPIANHQIDITNAPPIPTSPGSFFSSVLNYFTSFDTTLDGAFGANRGAVWTGVDAIEGGQSSLANCIGLSYDIYRTAPATNGTFFAISGEAVTRTGGVTGSLMSQGGGIGLSFVVHDVRLTGYVEGVYQFADGPNQFGAEIGMRVFKALGQHTFTGIGFAAQIPANIQIFSAFVGFTF